MGTTQARAWTVNGMWMRVFEEGGVEGAVAPREGMLAIVCHQQCSGVCVGGGGMGDIDSILFSGPHGKLREPQVRLRTRRIRIQLAHRRRSELRSIQVPTPFGCRYRHAKFVVGHT